jgi:6-phosphogluconolactonase
MLNVFNTADDVLQALAEYFVIIGNEAIAKNKKFSVALSGGSSPKKLYELLAADFHDKLNWEKV